LLDLLASLGSSFGLLFDHTFCPNDGGQFRVIDYE